MNFDRIPKKPNTYTKLEEFPDSRANPEESLIENSEADPKEEQEWNDHHTEEFGEMAHHYTVKENFVPPSMTGFTQYDRLMHNAERAHENDQAKKEANQAKIAQVENAESKREGKTPNPKISIWKSFRMRFLNDSHGPRGRKNSKMKGGDSVRKSQQPEGADHSSVEEILDAHESFDKAA